MKIRIIKLFLLPLGAVTFFDVILAATFSAGTLFYDKRLELLPAFSANQFLAVLGCGAVAVCIFKYNMSLLVEEFPAMVLVTASLLGLTLLYSTAVDYGWEKWVHFSGFGLLGVVWCLRSEFRNDRCGLPLLLLGGVGILLGIGGLFQFVQSGPNGRLSTMGGGPIVFARWVCTGVLVYGYWFATEQKRWFFLFGPFVLALVVGLIFIILLSGSKGPLLGFIVASVFIGNSLLSSWSVPRRLMLTVAAFLGIGLLIYQLEPTIYMRFFLNPFGEESQGSWGRRFEWLQAGVDAINLLPWYGTGLGGWATFIHHYDSKFYPHNLIIEILVEAGPVLGGGILFWWFWRATVWWRRVTSSGPDAHIALKGLILFWGINASISGDLTDSRVLIVLLGFLWSCSRKTIGGQFEGRLKSIP